jgi:hypothetical protein
MRYLISLSCTGGLLRIQKMNLVSNHVLPKNQLIDFFPGRNEEVLDVNVISSS